jgi:hypothetical protein
MTALTDHRRTLRLEADRDRRLLRESRSLDREIAWYQKCVREANRPAVSLEHQMKRAQFAQFTRLTIESLLDSRDELDVELGALGLLEDAGRGSL